jgi:hypothetical protein
MATEQNVAEMANAFRHLLEAMKNWGGREIIELEPYKEPALRMIEPPHVADAISGEAGLFTEAVPEGARKGLTPRRYHAGAFVSRRKALGSKTPC